MMDIRSLRIARAALVCLPLAFAGCKGEGRSSAAINGEALAADRTALDKAPFTELSFVPGDVEAVVRVDLAALAARDADTPTMLDFLLRAQQPQAWQFLTDAGIRAGKELRAVYLIVGPGAADAPAILVAGVGEIDAQRAAAALATGGGVAERAPGGATVFVWPHEKFAQGMGSSAAEHDETQVIEESAVGVADGLLIIGPPALVRRALAVRAGEGHDVRQSQLARELTALAPTAVAWGVGRAGDGGVVREMAAGLKAGRFQWTMTGGAGGELQLRAEFASEAQAKAFEGELRTLIGAAALITRKTPMQATFERLRDDTPIMVNGTRVTIGAAL